VNGLPLVFAKKAFIERTCGKMDEKDICILKKLYENEYISGEELASLLHVSRMAINKRIKIVASSGLQD